MSTNPYGSSGLKPASIPGWYRLAGPGRNYVNPDGDIVSKRQYDRARREGVTNEAYAKQRRESGIRNPMQRYRAFTRHALNIAPDRYDRLQDVRSDPAFRELYEEIVKGRQIDQMSPEARKLADLMGITDDDADFWSIMGES